MGDREEPVATAVRIGSEMTVFGGRTRGARLFDRFDSTAKVAVILFVTITSLAPMVWVLLSSFKTNRQVLDSALSVPRSLSLDSYSDVLSRSRFELFFFNSLVVSVGATVLAVAVFGMAAYVLARFEFRGRRAVYAMIISTILISLIPLQQPILRTVRELGLHDTLWGLMLVNTARGMPIVVFVMHSFFKSMPREIEEAAVIDGANFMQVYVRVMLPLAKPAAAASGVLVFLNSWNDFLFALLLTQSEETRTLSYALRFFVSTFSYNFPTLFAAIVLTLLPSIVIYVLLQEQVQKSFGGGAVKG